MLNEAGLRPIPEERMYLRGLPEEVYDKSDSSHIVQVITAMCGESGVKSVRRFMFMERLHTTLEATEFSDLDVLFGGLFRLPRLVSEQYSYNPLSDLLTDDEWAQVKSADASYRKRIWMYMNAIANGGTVEGIRYAAQAAIGEPCDVVESFRAFLANGYADGDALPSLSVVERQTSVIAVNDDIMLHVSGDLAYTGTTYVRFGGVWATGVRLQIPVYPGEVLEEARLVFDAPKPISSDVDISIIEYPAHDFGDAPPLDDGTYPFNEDLLAYREATTTTPWTASSSGGTVVSADISAAIQYAVDSAGWEYGGYVTLVVYDDTNLSDVATVSSFEKSPSAAPKLLLGVSGGAEFPSRFSDAKYGEVIVVPSTAPITESERQLWKRQVHLATSRVKPQDAIISTMFRDEIMETIDVDDGVIVPTEVDASSVFTRVVKRVTGRSDWAIPVDAKRGFWIEPGVRKIAPLMAHTQSQESVIDMNSSIQSITTSSNHVGVYNDMHHSLYPYLRDSNSKSESTARAMLREWSKKAFHVSAYAGRLRKGESMYE